MDWLRQWSAQIRAQLAELTVSQKMLIATLLLVIPITLFIVAQYAGSPRMVPVLDQALEPGRQSRITAHLESRGINYTVDGNRILVPAGKRHAAQAALAAEQLLPKDTSQGFSTIIEKQNWWQSSQQNKQMYNVALQNELARVLEASQWVRSATVIISRPEDEGFGATRQRPTASVNVAMASGRLDQHKVDAIAGLVSGAVAEMTPKDVTVIDAVAGRQWKVRPDDRMIPGDYLKTLAKQERYYRKKIDSALSYIDNVIVAVNVKTDLTRTQTEKTTYDRASSVELLESERSKEQRRSEAQQGGQPGVRANTGADIAGGSGGGQQSVTEESESEFKPFAGRTHQKSSTPGGAPKRISTTVNVPRSFFVARYRQNEGNEGAEPTDQQLQPIIEQHTERIRRQVEPLVSAENEGQVVVDVYPHRNNGPAAAAPRQTAGTGTSLLASGVIRYVGLGALALLSLAMMGWMVRKASQKPQAPDPEELAGVPQEVSSAEQMVGEAGEADSAMPGVELDDETLRNRQISQQVSDLVKENPSEVAGILKNWADERE